MAIQAPAAVAPLPVATHTPFGRSTTRSSTQRCEYAYCSKKKRSRDATRTREPTRSPMRALRAGLHALAPSRCAILAPCTHVPRAAHPHGIHTRQRTPRPADAIHECTGPAATCEPALYIPPPGVTPLSSVSTSSVTPVQHQCNASVTSMQHQCNASATPV